MTVIRSLDEESLRRVARVIRDAERTVQRLRFAYQRDRKVWSRGGGASDKRGKPKAEIAGGADGTLVVHDSSGSTSEEVEVTNPYSLALPVELFCRAEKVDGWDKPLAVPDFYTACPDEIPTYIPQDA